jgi:hypothetical protein
MLLYTLIKKFIKVQRYMFNPFDSILFYKVVGWFDGQNIGAEPKRPRFNSFAGIYYVEYVYLYIYIVRVCKCIIHRWVVDR